MFSLPLAHINAKFIVDGEEFIAERFDIDFGQPTDYKGQPQHEIKGGQFTITLDNSPKNSLYLWAKTPTSLKSGSILFQTDMGMTVLEMNFTNAYCINLTCEISAMKGSSTTLVVSPEEISLNGIPHTNYWRK